MNRNATLMSLIALTCMTACAQEAQEPTAEAFLAAEGALVAVGTAYGANGEAFEVEATLDTDAATNMVHVEILDAVANGVEMIPARSEAPQPLATDVPILVTLRAEDPELDPSQYRWRLTSEAREAISRIYHGCATCDSTTWFPLEIPEALPMGTSPERAGLAQPTSTRAVVAPGAARDRALEASDVAARVERVVGEAPTIAQPSAPLNKAEAEVVGTWIAEVAEGASLVYIFNADRTACAYSVKDGDSSAASSARWDGWRIAAHLGYDGTYHAFSVETPGADAAEVVFNSHATDRDLSHLSIDGVRADKASSHHSCPR